MKKLILLTVALCLLATPVEAKYTKSYGRPTTTVRTVYKVKPTTHSYITPGGIHPLVWMYMLRHRDDKTVKTGECQNADGKIITCAEQK